MLPATFTRQLRSLQFLVIPAILLYGLWMCWPATLYYFNTDDTANLAVARLSTYSQDLWRILSVWNNFGRLTGMLYVRAMYDWFGFSPWPYRVASLLFCTFNLILLNELLRKLTRNPWVRYLAMLIAAFNGCFWSIYASAGTMFDVLGLTFMLAAVLFYAATRRHPNRLSRSVVLALLTSFGIASKEIAYALPPILLLYELVIIPSNGGYDWIDFRRALPGLAVPFAVVLIAGLGTIYQSSVYAMDAYRPVPSLARFLETTKAHSELLMFRRIGLSAETWLMLWLALLA
ncbi:MAG: hypothetical protein ABI995_04010, partial [Acidobacteriota bacterium]